MHPCPWTDVEHIVGLADHILVVFNDDHRVALIPKVFQRPDKSVVVALVQTNRRLIEDVKNARQTRPNLRGKADTLAFPTRQRARVSAHCKVVEANVVEEPQPLADLFHNCAGDFLFLFAQRIHDAADPRIGLFDRLFDHLTNVQTRDFHGAGFFAQAVAATGSAATVVLELLEFFPHPRAIGFAVAAFHVRDHTFEGAFDLIDAATFIVAEFDFLFARTVEEHVLRLFGNVLPAGVFVEPIVFRNRLNRLEEIGRFPFAPRRNRTVSHTQGYVGDNQPFVKEQLHTKAITGWAGPERRIERKQARFDLWDGEARHGTGEFFAKGVAFRLPLARRCF